jgi:hypothetical protein
LGIGESQGIVGANRGFALKERLVRREIMSGHEIYHITEFKIVDDYTLWMRFDDDTEQIINFEPVLYGPVFEPLRDLKLFNQVKLDEGFGALEWSTGADFDPETLYNWLQYKDEIIANCHQHSVVAV